MTTPALSLRTYQLPVLLYEGKLLLVEFARQRGKSHTLANWAVRRMLRKLAASTKAKTADSSKKAYDWSIFVISNSRTNGIEFGQKVSEIMEAVRVADAEIRSSGTLDTDADPELAAAGDLPPVEVEDFFQRMEIRIGNRVGRILILAASPRTARGFSGDLILDEFAFHEHADRIWDAAEPIISSNAQFQVRIASTHNTPNCLFARMIRDGNYPVASITLSQAWRMGRGDRGEIEAFRDRWARIDPENCRRWWEQTGGAPQPQDAISCMSIKRMGPDGRGLEITPEEREAEAIDRLTYRKNYENEPNDGTNSPILSWEAIRKCSRAPDFEVDMQAWSENTFERIRRTMGDIYIGQDFARKQDLSPPVILLDQGELVMIGMLEMRNMKTPHQRREMRRVIMACGHRLQRVVIDMTGEGSGLAQELEEEFGSLILGVHFSTTTEIDSGLRLSGDKRNTMPITERMALDLSQWMEDGRLLIPDNQKLHDDLRKPHRVQTGKTVTIAAAKDAEGHADRFWSIALALHGKMTVGFGAWTAQDVQGALVGGRDDVFDPFSGVGSIQW
jgi:phage FluMu gp28-like protein